MAQNSTSAQQDQRDRATNYKTTSSKSQIPTTYGCAGDCSQPAPPAPGSDMEMFRGAAASGGASAAFWGVVGTAAAIFIAATLFGSKRRA